MLVNRWLFILWSLLLVAAWAVPVDRFESTIQAYEAADRKAMPKTGGTLFLGSSTFTLWGSGLESEFGKFEAINRGFGGSTLAEIDHYRRRIAIPYSPRTIVLYAGTNDVAEGHRPQQVFDDFKTLVTHLRADLPKVRIAYISMSMPPSRARWEAEYRQANGLIKHYLEGQSEMKFIDVSRCLLDDQGRPRPEFFQTDQLHMNPKGYAVWVPYIREYLESCNDDRN